MEVIFKPLKEEHLEFLLEIRNDDTTRFMLEVDSKFTLEECSVWYQHVGKNWFVIENTDGELVGYFRTFGDEIGCDIHPKHRRKGYARKAYLEYLKNKTYAKLWVFDDNFAKNLYVSLGFKPTGNSKTIRNRLYIEMVWGKND